MSSLETDLNRIYMGYSLPRMDYFKNVRVSATGDVDTIHFYGISTAVLFLLLCAIPVSAYLALRICVHEGSAGPYRSGGRGLWLQPGF